MFNIILLKFMPASQQCHHKVIFSNTISDNNTVFFAGGADGVRTNYTSYCATYFLDLTTKTWTQGPNMTHCRYYHTCSMITNATTGGREIVVVGGWDGQRPGRCRYIQDVEIFNLDTQQWRNGEEKMEDYATSNLI